MLSDALRTRTRPHHDAAEASPAMQAVVSDGLTREAYREHLARLLPFTAGTEAALGAVPGLRGWLPDLDARLVKTAWLRADLAALAARPRQRGGHAPELDVPAALGTLYVVEGSTLGGRIIERHLHKTLGVTPDDGGRFYHAYGPDRGPRWTAFKAALDAYGDAHPHHTDAVVDAAGNAFEAFAAWLAAPADPADA